jgi:hypothetical protein
MVKKNLILPTDVFPNGLSEIKYARIRAVEKEYGVGRWTMFQLIKAGLVRTVLIKSSKKGRGYRLVDLRSLEAWMDSHATGGEAPSNKANPTFPDS